MSLNDRARASVEESGINHYSLANRVSVWITAGRKLELHELEPQPLGASGQRIRPALAPQHRVQLVGSLQLPSGDIRLGLKLKAYAFTERPGGMSSHVIHPPCELESDEACARPGIGALVAVWLMLRYVQAALAAQSPAPGEPIRSPR